MPVQTFYYVCFGFVAIICGLMYYIFKTLADTVTSIQSVLKIMVKTEVLKSVLSEVFDEKLAPIIDNQNALIAELRESKIIVNTMAIPRKS